MLAALETAELAEWLKTAGPISFFAPTDEAFAKLPKGRLADLLRPESRAELRSILLYQMVSGRYSTKDVRYMYSARTLEGHKLSFHYFSDGMRVDNARVLSAVPASNGVLHAIDSVIMPFTPVLIER
jgi:transforming growth factor-beta-induced protein